MKVKHIIFIVFFSVILSLVFFMCLSWGNHNTTSENKKDPVELVFTENELKEIHKWKNKSMDDLMTDVDNGDKAAMYNLGMYLLFGMDLPINVDYANYYLSQSASLGFAPALDQMAKMYTNDESNPFLGLIYKNLTIAFGHPEFTMIYHELRDKILKDFGQSFMHEIERIATEKMLAILNNKSDLEEASNKKDFVGSMKNITSEDHTYSKEYWQKLYSPKHNLEQTPWFMRIDSLQANEETKEFLRLIAKGFLGLSTIKSCQISDFDVQNYLEHNVPELMQTKAGQKQICSDLKKLNSIPIMQGDTVDEICKEYGGDWNNVPFNIEDEVYKRIGCQTEKIISEFKKRIKYA